jgi:hypothetical protein
MNVKKQYADLVAFLEANANKKVSTIIDEIYEMTAAQRRASTVYKDDDGNVIAIYCYYHKQWEVVAEVAYGAKANSATGLNTLCKVGAQKWTKAQRDAKAAKESLLTRVATGEVAADTLKDALDDIEERRQAVDMTDAPNGFATIEELEAYLA